MHEYEAEIASAEGAMDPFVCHPDEGGPFSTVVIYGIDAAERFLVTASDDKTARVWDLETGRLLRVLHPPIGAGDEGKLYAVAIPPDGAVVAAA